MSLSKSSTKVSTSDFQTYGYPFDIGSTMMYCSICMTFSGSPDFTAKDGSTWGNLMGQTTLGMMLKILSWNLCIMIYSSLTHLDDSSKTRLDKKITVNE